MVETRYSMEDENILREDSVVTTMHVTVKIYIDIYI